MTASVLTVLRPIAKQLTIKDIDIYNHVFQLHTKLTFLLLLACSALVSAHEFFGKTIDCSGSQDRQEKRKEFYDNLCWINGTYTVASGWSGSQGVHFMAPGVNGGGGGEAERTYHQYYQWVNLVLFLAAMISYLPAYLWRRWERGLMKALCKGLDVLTPSTATVPDADTTAFQQRRCDVLHYLLTAYRRQHAVYALRFIVCEWLNLVCVLANMWLLDVIFADGFWRSYAPAVRALVAGDRDAWSRHTATVFPKLAKCDYFEFGPSGSMERKDIVCVLSLNVLNEKLFAGLWLWFVGLLAVSAANVMWRALCCASPALRVRLLQAQAFAERLSATDVRAATVGATLGEWFVLHQMGRNVQARVFGEIVRELALDPRRRCEAMGKMKDGSAMRVLGEEYA